MATFTENRLKLAEYIRNNPNVTFKVIAAKVGCSLSTVAAVAREHHISRMPRILTDLNLSALDGE